MVAARSGARTVLLERYGHLGGMATGGIVIQIPHMSDGGTEPVIAGLALEWLERLDVIGGTLRPRMEDIGSDDPALVARWRRFMGNVVNGLVELSKRSFAVTPEMGRSSGEARMHMRKAMNAMEGSNGYGASHEQGLAMGSLNKAAMQV